jgi:hypothetical protein
MVDYKKVWRSPLRIGVSLGMFITYCACWANDFGMVEKLFWGGITIILVTFVLFISESKLD